MLVCASPQFLTWRPDFSSSEQPSPHWAKLICDGEQLSNAINAVSWVDAVPAVQVELCESCGYPDCESGGYVHVSRLRSHLLWTPPHVDPDDPFESYQYRSSDPVRRHGGVAIAVEEWETWRRRFALPPVGEFPQTARRDLFAAWRAEAQILGKFDSPDRLLELARERAIAAHPSGLDDALTQLEAVAAWFTADPEAVVEGKFGSVPEDTTPETIYFDVPDTFDRGALREWRATALVDDHLAPVFGGGLVLLPPPV